MSNNDPRMAQQYPAQHAGERLNANAKIDQIIDMVRDAKGVTFSSNCQIDRDEMIALLTELKATLPASVAQSNDIVKRAQEIIGTAREKSKKVLNDADRMYAMRVNEHEITRGAQARAAEIIAEANQQSEELRKSAHVYAKKILSDCDQVLSQNIAKVQSTLNEINSAISKD